MKSKRAQLIADTVTPAIIPNRTANGRKDPRRTDRGLTPNERCFVDALVHEDTTATEAYRIATGSKGGGGNMIARPQVQAAIALEIGKMRTLGRVVGTKQLMKLVDLAKSEYVQADVAKYLSGDPTKAPGPAAGVTININLGGERMTITADATDPTADS